MPARSALYRLGWQLLKAGLRFVFETVSLRSSGWLGACYVVALVLNPWRVACFCMLEIIPRGLS